jgi:hypothetical protein
MDWLQDLLNTISKVLVLLSGKSINTLFLVNFCFRVYETFCVVECGKEVYLIILLKYPGGQLLAFLVALLLLLLRKLHGDLHVMLPFLRYAFTIKNYFVKWVGGLLARGGVGGCMVVSIY